MKAHTGFKSFIRTFVLHYFMIYGLTMLMTPIFCLIFNREATFDISYFGLAALFALAADAPLAVYISRDELTNKQYWIRTVIHGCLLEAGLIPIGYAIDMWNGVGGFFLFFFAVLFVDAAMHFLEYLNAKSLTDRINKVIRARRLAKPSDSDGGVAVDGGDTAEEIESNNTEDSDGR